MENLALLLPSATPRSVALFPSDVTHIELVNQAPKLYEAEWQLTLWESSGGGRWRSSTRNVGFARVGDFGPVTGWNIRWSYLVVKEALDALTIPGYSGLRRCLTGSTEPQELRFRIYHDSIRVYRTDDATVWEWYRKLHGWYQR